MGNTEVIGVYKLYKLGRIDGNKFDPEQKLRVERDSHLINHDFANQTNANSQINGLLYEFEKEKTELWEKGKPFKNETEFTKFEEVDEEKEALITEYTELKGEVPKGTWGVKKLTEEIAKLKNE